jgi:hypothetical protein
MNLDQWLRSQIPLFNDYGIRQGWGSPTYSFNQPTFQRRVYRITDQMGGRVTTSGYVLWQRERVPVGPGGRIHNRTWVQALRLFPESDHGLRQWGFQGSAGTMRIHLRHYRQYNLTVASLIAAGYSLGPADRRAFSLMDQQAKQLLVQQITLLAISVLSAAADMGPIAGAASAPGNALGLADTMLN